MLETDRYCPRCDIASDGETSVTRWTNPDGGLQLACEVCGLTITSPLTPDERTKLAAYEARPVRYPRRAYVVC